MTGERVVAVAARGDGVTEGCSFVPLAAPGDLVLADGTLVPGPHHAAPPCRHFPTCGGCRIQHLDEAAERAFLVDRVEGALSAQRLAGVPVANPHLSPPRTRRRASFRAERRGRAVQLGFNEAASHRIVDMRECHILHPALWALVGPVRALLGTLLPERGGGEARMTLADQGVDLLLAGVRSEDLAAAEALTAFAVTHSLARLAVDEGLGAEARWEPAPVTVTLGSVAVPLPHGAFLQATADGEAALMTAVERIVGGAATVLDLFAGLGTFALPLARGGSRVLAAEGARDALLALKGAAARGGQGVVTDHRDLFRRPYTPAELDRFDAVVLDPPRAGAKEQVAALAASTVRRIAYVSCNPATFARDARTLVEGGYRLAGVQPVGQFRWSTHVELVGGFVR